jgi:selenocysteine-specific elongation factor
MSLPRSSSASPSSCAVDDGALRVRRDSALIIGTAGHVDHGKTTLVKALTGVDTDRLKEEKLRGISIDLGFAYLPVADDMILGFVDVPGHERFVHTMVAGAGGIDFALLVVAADDGVMPQTREHLAILDLLGIERGLVAITKTELASAERLAQVSCAVRAAVSGTFLAQAEVVPLSAFTGRGIPVLLDRLSAAARESVVGKSADALFRLSIDRVFTLHGIGLVITGTVMSGSVRSGDRILISPSGLEARVRSLHAQGRPMEVGHVGDRCALNLGGDRVSKQAIHRGDMAMAPELHAPTARIDAHLRLLESESGGLGRQRFAVRLHHAAAEVGARVVLLDDERPLSGGSANVQLVLDRPIAAAVSDRFVLRDASAKRTVGGGRFIDLRPPSRRRRARERTVQRAAHAIADPVAAFEALLSTPPFAWDLAAFARDRALSKGSIDKLVSALRPVLLDAGPSRMALAAVRWQHLYSSLIAALGAYHVSHPDRQGIGRDELRLLLEPALAPPVFDAALARPELGEVMREGGFLRLRAHHVHLSLEDEDVWSKIAPLLGGEARFRPPRVRDIAAVLVRPEQEIRRLLKLAGRIGRVDQVAHDHFFLRSTVSEMVNIAATMASRASDGTFVAAQFRDQLANGRKVAIQILEFFDRHGITQHQGDLRRINHQRLGLFHSPS